MTNEDKDHIRQTDHTSRHKPFVSGVTRSLTLCSQPNFSDSKGTGSPQIAQAILAYVWDGREPTKRPN